MIRGTLRLPRGSKGAKRLLSLRDRRFPACSKNAPRFCHITKRLHRFERLPAACCARSLVIQESEVVREPRLRRHAVGSFQSRPKRFSPVCIARVNTTAASVDSDREVPGARSYRDRFVSRANTTKSNCVDRHAARESARKKRFAVTLRRGSPVPRQRPRRYRSHRVSPARRRTSCTPGRRGRRPTAGSRRHRCR